MALVHHITLPSKRNVLGQRDRGVVELLVLVHPDFCRATSVARENVSGSTGKRVRMLLAEDVTHAAAWNDLETAAALPHAERNF